MAERIHILVDAAEKERFRRRAEAEGKSLSEWLRDAAREKAVAEASAPLSTLDELDALFEACDRREEDEGPEPDWVDHLRVMETSRRRGRAEP